MSGTSVTLSWSASSGATYYSLGVRDMASGALVVDTNVSGTSFTASLSAGKQYRWNVAACNTAGCSSFTTPLYFQTPTPVSIPATPLNPSPGSPTSPGPTMSGTSVTLSWSASSGATYYSLGVRDMASGALVVDTNVSGTSFTASLSAGKQYRWNVAACNTAGCSSFTTPLYFQTPTPVSIPATPLNPSPGSPTSPGPTMSGTSVTLSWSASSGATYYSLGVRDMASGALVVDTNVSGTSFTASLSAGKQYRWNVAACNTAGCSSFTTPLYFQTPTPVSIPATPLNPSPGSPTSPGPTMSGTSVTLSWSASSGATYYSLGVRDMASGALVVDTNVSGTSFTASLSAGKQYRWNVAACNTAGCSSFTTPLYFQTPDAAPSITAYSTSPSSPAAGQPFTINISGNNFNASTAQILFTGPGCSPCTVPNGALSTKSATLLIGPVTLNTAGTYTVAVQNGSGGATSNGLSLTIGGATPLLSGLSTNPNPPVVGQQFTLTISGSSFDPSTVQILVFGTGCGPCTVPNGVLTTKTATQIAGPVTLNSAGSFDIRVQNGSGGGQSNSLSLTVGAAAPAPAVSWISPTTMPADGVSRTLTVYGSNFQSGNIVQFRWGVGAGAGVWNTGTGNPPNILSSSQMTISMNPGTVTDTIYVRVCRSASQTGSEDCSSGTHSVTVTGAGVPDLVPGSLVISPNPVQAGQRLSFSFSVRNAGSAAATATTTTRVQLSGSASAPSLSDPLLASLATPPLGIGASVALSGSGTVPSSLAPGTYYVWVIVDADNQLSGQNTANDRIAVPVMVLAPGTEDLASLASQTDIGGVQVFSGQNFAKSWTLRNTGTSTWDSRYRLRYVSGNAGCSHSDVMVTGTVAPNSTYTFSITCTAPATAGTYREDWRLVGPSGAIPVSGSPTVYLIVGVKASQTPVDGVTIVSETVSDGSPVLPGENFVKVWRLKNTGTTTWTNYRAAFVQYPGGGATSINLLASGASVVPVPSAAPGDIVDLSLPLRAPTTLGVYASYWQLQNAGGTAFGPLLGVRIQVQESGITLQITPRQTYDAATRTLALAASVRDSLSRSVSTGNFTWALRDSTGTQRAAGSLTYQGGEWNTRHTMPTPLAPGLYTVQYNLTDGGRSGSAVGSFSVGDLVDITGTVRDGKSRTPLAGVEVRAGGNTTQTDSSGKYALTGLSPSALSTISATKPGYTSYEYPLQASSGNRIIVRDIELSPASPSKPVITAVTPQYEGTFLAGVPFTNRYSARVTWNGNPGVVDFYYDGELVASVPATASSAEASFDVGSGSSSSPAVRTLRVIARNQAGASSDPFDKKIALAPIPGWLKRLQGVLLCGVPSAEFGRFSVFPTCTTAVSIVDLQKVLQLPVLDRFGAEVSIGAEVEYDIQSAQLDIVVGAELSGEWKKAGRRPDIPFLTRYPKLKFYVGNKEISGSVTGGGRGTYIIGRGWTDFEPHINFNLKGRLEGTRINLLNYFAGLGTILDRIGLREVTDLSSFPLYFIFDFDAEAVFVLNPTFTIDSGDLDTKLGVELAYEPKLAGLAELRVYAGGQAAFEVLPQLLKDLAVQVYVGYKARVWKWENSGEFILIEFSRSSSQGAEWIAIPVWSPDATDDLRPLKRDYLDAGQPRFLAYEPNTGKEERQAAALAPIERFRAMVSGYSRAASGEYHVELPFVSNTFPYSEPSIAARGTELMMVYVADSGSADPARFTDIHYAFFNGSDWSQPVAISTDVRAEFAPKVAFDGNGDAIAVWEREKDASLGADASIEAVASKMEIVWSRWDRTTRTWSTTAALTDNDHLDHSPLLVGPMEDGSLIAVWTENPSNLMVGRGAEGSPTASRVWWVRWDAQSRSWGQPSLLVPSVVGRSSQSLAGAGRRAIYAWTRDRDGDLATSSDQELSYMTWDGQGWSPVRQLTQDAIADRNVRSAVTPSGEIFLVWQRGNDLVLDRNLNGTPAVIRQDSGTLGFGDFTLTAGPSGNLVLLWQGSGAQGTNVFYRVFDPASNSWSEDLQLTNNGGLERSLAAAWDSVGNLTLAYNLVAVNKVNKTVTLDDGRTVQIEGALEFGQVDLRLLKFALRRDVGILQNGLTVDCAPCLPGQTATIAATVENLGDLPVSDVTVAFYGGDPSGGGPEIGRSTIPGLLRAGERAAAKTSWVPSAPLASQELFAVVDPDNRIGETDEANNTASLRVGGLDLSLSLRSATAEPDGSARIVVEIRNAGTLTSGGARVDVTPVGVPANVLATADIPALNLAEAAEIALTLPSRSVRAEQSQFDVTVTSTDDVNTANNKILVAIQPLDIQLKTVDTPQILPQGGQFNGPISATITCATEGAVIRYTTNGKDPTEDDPVIPSGASVPITSSVTLKARAWKSGWVESAVAEATFTVAGVSHRAPDRSGVPRPPGTFR